MFPTDLFIGRAALVNEFLSRVKRGQICRQNPQERGLFLADRCVCYMSVHHTGWYRWGVQTLIVHVQLNTLTRVH